MGEFWPGDLVVASSGQRGRVAELFPDGHETGCDRPCMKVMWDESSWGYVWQDSAELDRIQFCVGDVVLGGWGHRRADDFGTVTAVSLDERVEIQWPRVTYRYPFAEANRRFRYVGPSQGPKVDPPRKEGTMSISFSVGDRVRCINNDGNLSYLTIGHEYVVNFVETVDSPPGLLGLEGVSSMYFSTRFEKIDSSTKEGDSDMTENEDMIGQLRVKAEKFDALQVNLCENIRAAGRSNNYDFCESGLAQFCRDNGIEYTPERLQRRAVLHMDLSSGTFNDQRGAMRQLLAFANGLPGIGWKWLTMDNDDNRDETEWDSSPDDSLGYTVT